MKWVVLSNAIKFFWKCKIIFFNFHLIDMITILYKKFLKLVYFFLIIFLLKGIQSHKTKLFEKVEQFFLELI